MNDAARVPITDRYPGARDDLECPECRAPMVLKEPGQYKAPWYACSMWFATRCPGSHSAHPDGAPMGVPANQATKNARIRAHDAFDGMWRGMGMRRRDAYRWMQKQLGLEKAEAHIGKFTIEQCDRLVAVVADTLERGHR